MFQFDYRRKHFPDADAKRKPLMYSPSPVPPHPSPVHSDALTDCNARHTVLTGSSFPFSHFVSSYPIISGGRTRTPFADVERQAMANPAGPRYFPLASQHASPLHTPPSSSLSSPAVTPKPRVRETPSVNSFKTGQSIYSYAKRARMDARNQRRREERARTRGRPRASEPGAAATARAKAAARIGAIGLGRPGLGRKRKRTQEPGGSHVSGEAETGQSTAAPAGLLGTGDLAVRSLSSLSNATDTRRASVRVVARATVPGASLSLGLLGLSNLSTAGGAPKDRANIVAGGLGNLDGKESEDPGTENDTEEDEDYAPAKVPRPYTGAGAGAARPVTSSSPNTTGIAPSLPQVASIPHTKSRAFPTPSSRGRRPRIPHSYRTSNHSNNNPNVTDMATFGFWTDAKKIVLFMHYLEDPEPSVEARRAMADQVALDTSQVSKFMSRTRSEIARGTMSERLKRLLRVAQDKVKARLVDGTESGATGDAVIHPPQGLADSSGSGSDVDAEFEVEVTQVPSHAELNGCQGKGEEECSSWRMDVDAASSEVALALLSLSASHGPSCSSSVISASLECDATTPDAAAVPSSPPGSRVVADYVEYMRTPSFHLLPAPLPCVSSPISAQPHFPSQTNTSSNSREPEFMSSETTSTCASGYSTMTFPSPISHETVLIPASPDQSHELLRLQGKQPDESSAAGQKFDTGADTPNNVVGLDSSSPYDDFGLPLVPPVCSTEAEMESIPNSLPCSQDQKAAHSKLYPPSSDVQNQSHSQSQTQSISLHVPMGLQSNKHLSHVYSPRYPQQQPCATSSSPSPTTTRFSSSPSSTFNNSNYNDSGALESLVPGLHPIEHALFRIPLIRSTPIRPHTAKAESVEAVQLPGPPTTFVNAFVHSPRPGRSPISSADLQAWAETGHFLPSPSLSGSTAVGSDSVVSSAPATTASPLPKHQYLAYLKSQQQQRPSSSRIRAEQQISFGHSSKRNTCWEKRVPTEATTIVAPIWGRQAASSHIEQDQTHSHPQPRSQHRATVRSQYSGYGGLAESGSESMSAVEMISRAHHLQNYRRAVTPVPSLSAPCKRQPQTLKSTALPSLSMYLPQSSSFQQPSHRHSPGGSHLIPPSLAGSPDSVAETRTFDPAFQTSLPIEHRDSSSRDAQNTAVEASQHAIYPSTSSFENNHHIMHSKSNYPH